jgi:hypothetical protein
MEHIRRLLRERVLGSAVASLGDGEPDGQLGEPLAAGGYQRAGDVVEVLGVPTFAGATTVFLSAQDDAVARVYERVGFRRVATAGIAEPPS